MVANRQTPKQGTVQDLINGLLDRGYTATVQPVLNAVGRSTGSGLIQQRLNELDAEVARLMASGDKLTPDNPVLRALLADLEDTMAVNGRVVDSAAQTVQQNAVDAAAKVQRQIALPGMTNAQLASIGIKWNVADPEAVMRLVGYSQSDAWAAALAKYGEDIVNIVNNQAIRGIASGWSPLRTAREIRTTTELLPAHQANTLMRTLQLTSYRDATAAQQNVNVGIIEEVVRIAALDKRTCLSCVALHGRVIWSSERDAGTPITRVDDHQNGRCTSVVRVKGRPLNIQSGEQWFDNLPPDRQRQQGGFATSPAKWEAYQSGQVKLNDFVHAYTDNTFGDMLREASLADTLKNAKNGSSAAPPPAPGRVATVNGFIEADSGTPGSSIQTLNTFLDNSRGPLAQQILDFEMGLTTLDFDTGAVAIDPDGVRTAAKRFVAESQNIQYGKNYLLSLVQEQAAENGVNVSGADVEKLMNEQYAIQAKAILTTAQIGNVRLTEAQLRRLTAAANGNYLSIVYTTTSSEAGSLANAALGGYSQGVMTDAARKAKREEFLDRLGRLGK